MKLSEERDMYYTELKNLDPFLVKRYLISHDWLFVQEHADHEASLWAKSENYVRLMHNSNKYADYLEIMAKLIKTVSEVDDLTKWSVIDEINSISAMRTRLEIEDKIMDLLNEIEGPLLYDNSIVSEKKTANLDALRWVLHERDEI